MRVVEEGERNDAGSFAPVVRPRLVDRLASSARYPVALLIAPAGYGKSVVLRQYLGGLREPHVRFALRPEHSELLSFLRGFAEALSDFAPHAITALAGAYERTTASSRRSAELARWMHAHLDSFEGLIAIDDLHIADGDLEVAAFLASLIERTKGRIRWILASRAATNLPLGTWFAYRDADAPIDEESLRFTLEEVRSAAAALRLATRDDELDDLLALTEGWPAAISFALRTSTRSSDLRNVSALTREMIYRFLAEQVYNGLDEGERALLEVAIALPMIDVAVLERAGFDRALPIVERLRDRTAFIYEESSGVYQCHELFREFLRHQSALHGKRSHRLVHEKAARALESSGDIEHAIAAYVMAACVEDVVRLLELHGFDLLERARGDVVGRAIDSLDVKTRQENPSVLALQGALHAIAGKFPRAESLLRRSLARAGTNRNLVAIASLRLASLMGNQGNDVEEILGPLATDNDQCAEVRAEALSLIGARQAISGDTSSARRTAETIHLLLEQIQSSTARAKILHHLGIVRRHVGEVSHAFAALTESSDLAAELHLYSVASRANSVLSNLALHEEDDVRSQLRYAEAASAAASKAGDAFALQTALLQILSAHTRRGDIESSIAVERRLEATVIDDSAKRYLALFKSVRLAWAGQFGDAHRLIASCWAQTHFDFDRVSCGAQYALFLALDGDNKRSTGLIQEILDAAISIRATGLFGTRALAIGRAFCALAETANGRYVRAERIIGAIKSADAVVGEVAWIAKVIARIHLGLDKQGSEAIAQRIGRLGKMGYGDVARLLDVVNRNLQNRFQHEVPRLLTASEQEVLRFLAHGLVPKEIATETGRSVHTVRVHITNAIEKLGCHGRAQAIMRARQLGLILPDIA